MTDFNDLLINDKIAHKMKLMAERELNPVKQKEKKIIVKNTPRTLEEKEENLIKKLKELIDEFFQCESPVFIWHIFLFNECDKNGKRTDEKVEVVPRLISLDENDIFSKTSSWSKYKKHFEEELKFIKLSYICLNYDDQNEKYRILISLKNN